MFYRYFTLVFCFFIFGSLAIGQSDDPALFWIDDEAITSSEFMYIYEKNNSGHAQINKSSMKEYLELYKNFKLKVHHARQLKLDTIVRLKDELKGYRDQLAATYLNDNNVMGRLTSEAYERKQKEAEISHILLKLPKKLNLQDTLPAFKLAMGVYKTLSEDGLTFSSVAKQRSQDESNKNEGGYIGYVKAILPKGYYGLESTIYKLVPGNISRPVRSPRGYHIVYLHALRDAKPEVNIAQILVRKKKGDKGEAQRRINDIHHRLGRGVNFEETASKESDDKESAKKGGLIGYVKVGKYETEFEQAAYALAANGDVSQPIETRIGFHILKRIGIKEKVSFKDARRKIESELRRTEREDLARQAMINRIKSEEKIEMNEANKLKLFASLDKSIFSYRWKKPKDLENNVLFSFANGQTKRSNDFLNYLVADPKERVRLKNRGTQAAMNDMYNQFINKTCLTIEKDQLEQKHPEFASLMNEYEEGILLFEITKENVWDKASADTVGLKQYFQSHRPDFLHPKRIDIITYTIVDSNPKSAKRLSKKLKKKSAEEITTLFPHMPNVPSIVSRTDDNADEYAWKLGRLSVIQPIGTEGTAFKTSKTIKVIPPKEKELKECRGYVIADYQEALEKQWLAQLRTKYTIKENTSAIHQLIK